MPRGILGLPKDPKNQILFSFNVREGEEWPSSDSDDSDFLPSDEDEPVERTKKKQSGSSQSRQSKSRANKHSTNSGKRAASKQKQRRMQKSSDDSDDSDYMPSDEDTPIKKKKKKSLNSSKLNHSRSSSNKHSAHKTGKQSVALTSKVQSAANGHKSKFCSGKPFKKIKLTNDDLFSNPDKSGDAGDRCRGWSWSKLPPEIWLKIFHYVTDVAGAIPFVCRISKVCVGFHELSSEPSLWRNVDLSYGWIKSVEPTMKWLCENRLHQCEKLNLSTWKNPSSALTGYAASLQHLKKINLSYCKNLTHAGVMALQNCPDLNNLDLSYTSLDAMKGVKYLVEKIGGKINHLNIAGSLGNSTGIIINVIADNCKNLEVLDVSDVRFTINLDIERLQKGCCKLRVLRLACTSFASKPASQAVQDASDGFPDLEQLSLGVKSLSASSTAIDNRFLTRVLKSSSSLQLLDLRGCPHFTCLGLLDLPVTDLKYLYISQCSAVRRDLDVLLKKWCHSLVEIDLSWNSVSEDYLYMCMQVFSEEVHPCKLENLDLSGTSVTSGTLRLIMSFAKSLKYIDLTSCRGLNRGMKRKYSENNIHELHEMLHELISDEEIT